MGGCFWSAARDLVYAPSHRQDNTYHGLCYTSCGIWPEWEIAQWFHHEGLIRRPIIPWADTLSCSYVSLLKWIKAPQFYIFQWTVQFAPTFHHWNVHIFLFGLILRDIQSPLTPSPFFFLSWTEVPVPMTGMRYISLLWMCTINTLTWPDLVCDISQQGELCNDVKCFKIPSHGSLWK